MNQNNQQPGSAEILPCPFCGGESVTDFVEDVSYIIECDSCNCRTSLCGSADAAIGTWNRRATVSLASVVKPSTVDFRKPSQPTVLHEGMVLCTAATGNCEACTPSPQIAEELPPHDFDTPLMGTHLHHIRHCSASDLPDAHSTFFRFLSGECAIAASRRAAGGGDGCKFCLGAKGGVPGNANLIGGEVVCDYCTSLLLTIRDAERANPTGSVFAPSLPDVAMPDLLELLRNVRPNFNSAGSRTEVRAYEAIQARIGRAIELLALAAQPAEGSAQVAISEQVEFPHSYRKWDLKREDYEAPPFAAPASQHDADFDGLLGAIMNLPARRKDSDFASATDRLNYKTGHRDARHDACDLLAEFATRCRAEGGNTCDKGNSEFAAEGATPAGDARDVALEEAASLCDRFAARQMHPAECAGAIRMMKSNRVSTRLTAAARDVLAERRRQVEQEGWTPEHDDAHAGGQMAVAAGHYALACGHPYERDIGRGHIPAYWPWAPSWWKPRDKRSNLVRAGALVLAEIERLDRARIDGDKHGEQGEKA